MIGFSGPEINRNYFFLPFIKNILKKKNAKNIDIMTKIEKLNQNQLFADLFNGFKALESHTMLSASCGLSTRTKQLQLFS